MEGSTDRGLFGFGGKKEEQGGRQAQQVKPESLLQDGIPSPAESYSAAPGIPEGAQGGHKGGFMEKIGEKLGIDKLKKKKNKGEKKEGDGTSSSSSSEDEADEKKEKKPAQAEAGK